MNAYIESCDVTKQITLAYRVCENFNINLIEFLNRFLKSSKRLWLMQFLFEIFPTYRLQELVLRYFHLITFRIILKLSQQTNQIKSIYDNYCYEFQIF